MKQTAVFFAFFFGIAVTVVSAASSITGVGVYGSFFGGITAESGGGPGLSLRFGNFPIIEVEYNLANPRIGVAVDYWVMNDTLGKLPFSYYVGAGAFLGISFFKNPLGFDPGLRLPVGFQFFPLKKMELFLEAAPMIHLIPHPDLGFSAALGFRILF